MDGLRFLFLLLGCGLSVTAQRPSFGPCPDKSTPMPDFDLSKFLGVWYEVERVPTVFEAGASCVKNNYTKTADGKIHVENEIMTVPHIKRVVQGELKPAGKGGEGKISIKYALPVSWETTYHILKTDYNNYAILWNCVSLGIVHAQYAWLMTRERVPPGPVLQEAYGVLDEFGISRNFFVKTDHKECDVAAAAPDIVPTSGNANPKPDTATRTSSVSEIKTPAKEMLPPESSNDDKPEKATEVKEPEQDKVPVESAENASVMEDVPKAPSEMNQENSEKINVSSASKN